MAEDGVGVIEADDAGSNAQEPVIDLVDDGLSDSEVATRFAEWLSDLNASAAVEIIARTETGMRLQA